MYYKYTGGSHQPSYILEIMNFPSGVDLDKRTIDLELKKRSDTFGRSERQNSETNEYIIHSGFSGNISTGDKIIVEIPNKSVHSDEYRNSGYKKDERNYIARPFHGEYYAWKKDRTETLYPLKEKLSARKTICDVFAGALAKAVLKEFNLAVFGFAVQIGQFHSDRRLTKKLYAIGESKGNFFEPHRFLLKNWENPYILFDDQLKVIEQYYYSPKNSAGGKFLLLIFGLPAGLGDYWEDSKKLNVRISEKVLSIPSVKSVNFGIYSLSRSIDSDLYQTCKNPDWGITGGLSTGQPVMFVSHVKPIPTIDCGINGIDIRNPENNVPMLYERSDSFVVGQAAVIATAKIASLLVTLLQERLGDLSFSQLKFSYEKEFKKPGI